LRNLDRFATLGCAVLIGTSRKGFLGTLTGRPVDQRATASVVSSLAAALKGANVVRVHGRRGDGRCHQDLVRDPRLGRTAMSQLSDVEVEVEDGTEDLAAECRALADRAKGGRAVAGGQALARPRMPWLRRSAEALKTRPR